MKKTVFALALTMLLANVSLAVATEVTYSNQIKQIFATQCNGCHGESSPEYKVFKQDKQKWLDDDLGPRMDSYSYLVYFTGWPDTGALMRRLDDAKPGNMYQYLGENEAERQKNLATFKAWVGEWTTKRFKDLSKEELARIKVPY